MVDLVSNVLLLLDLLLSTFTILALFGLFTLRGQTRETIVFLDLGPNID
jgi:hypothetical protein